MKIIAVVMLALTLSGCGMWERFTAKVTGGGTETCHKGVMYVQFTSGATVAYNTDGTIMLCD
jgi:hypothetical protein